MLKTAVTLAIATITVVLLSGCPASSGYGGGGGGDDGSEYWLRLHNNLDINVSLRECWRPDDEDECLNSTILLWGETVNRQVERIQYTYFRLWDGYGNCAEATPSYDYVVQEVSELYWGSCDDFYWPDAD